MQSGGEYPERVFTPVKGAFLLFKGQKIEYFRMLDKSNEGNILSDTVGNRQAISKQLRTESSFDIDGSVDRVCRLLRINMSSCTRIKKNH